MPRPLLLLRHVTATRCYTSGVVSTRTERKAERRLELLDVAWTVVETHGETASMDAVADAAGITRPILYRHFGDATGLWAAIGERFTDELTARFTDLARHRGHALLEAATDAFIATLEAHPGIYRYLTRRPAPPVDGDGQPVQTFVATLGDAVASFLVADGHGAREADILAHATVGAIRAAGDRWLDHPDLPRSAVVGEVAALLWGGYAGFTRHAASPTGDAELQELAGRPGPRRT